MKKFLFLGILASLLVFAGCVSGGSAAGKVSGTASASEQGFGGEVTVTVTLEKGKITKVTADGPFETAGIGTNALIKLPPLMVEKNTVNVDSVSGATFTSDAILQAAKAAVAKIN